MKCLTHKSTVLKFEKPFDTNSLPSEHVTKKGHLSHCKKVRLSLMWLTIAFSKWYYFSVTNWSKTKTCSLWQPVLQVGRESVCICRSSHTCLQLRVQPLSASRLRAAVPVWKQPQTAWKQECSCVPIKHCFRTLKFGLWISQKKKFFFGCFEPFKNILNHS